MQLWSFPCPSCDIVLHKNFSLPPMLTIIFYSFILCIAIKAFQPEINWFPKKSLFNIFPFIKHFEPYRKNVSKKSQLFACVPE